MTRTEFEKQAMAIANEVLQTAQGVEDYGYQIAMRVYDLLNTPKPKAAPKPKMPDMLQSVTKLFNIKNHIIDVLGYIKAENGFAYVSDLAFSVQIKTDIQDGIYWLSNYAKDKVLIPDASVQPDDFPVMPTPNGKKDKWKPIGRLTSEDISKMYRALPFIGKDDWRANMKHVYANGQIVATDGGYMTYKDSSGLLTKEVLFPEKAVRIMYAGQMEVQVSQSEHLIKLECEAYTLIYRAFDEHYVDYKSAIPTEYECSVTLDKKPILEAIKVLRNYCNETSKQIVFEGEYLTAKDVDLGKEKQVHIGETFPFSVGFNWKLLETILKDIDGDKVQMASAISETGHRRFVLNDSYLLMPFILAS